MKSKFVEYIKLIPKGIANFDLIFDGIINSVKLEFGTLAKEEQDEIIKRRLICAGCKFMSGNAKKDSLQNYKSERTDDHCIICLCNIQLKTSSLYSNCGLEIYNQNNPNNIIPLKWEALKTNQNGVQ